MFFKELNTTFLTILSVLVLFFFTEAPYGEYPHLLSVASSSILFYLVYDFLKNKKNENIFIFVFLLMNWLYFQSPFLLNDKTYYHFRIIKDEYINEIATYTFFAIFLIYIGFFYFLKKVSALTPRNLKLSDIQLRNLTLIFIYVSIFYRIILYSLPELTSSLSNLIQIFFYAPTIALALYTMYIIRCSKKISLTPFHLLVLSFGIIEFLIRLSNTLFAQVGLLLVGIVIVYILETKKIPFIFIITTVLLLTPMYQARKYFRSMDGFANQKEFNIENGLFFFDQFVNGNLPDKEDRQKTRFDREHNRFENLSFLAHVVNQHKDGDKKFLHGKTFYWLPIAPVPRLIIPFKPVNEMGSTMSTNYGLRAEDSRSAINFPMIVEAYINFGFFGILVLSFLFGVSLKWFVMKFGAGQGDINLLIALNAFKQFSHAEGNITLVFGALIQVFLFWWILVNVFNVGKLPQEQD